MSGGNNILNRSAMQQIDHLAEIVEPLPRALMELTHEIEIVKTQQIEMNRRIDEEPIRCPMREAANTLQILKQVCDEIKDAQEERKKEVDRELKKHSEDITELKSNLKWISGGIMAINGLILGAIEWVRSLGNP